MRVVRPTQRDKTNRNRLARAVFAGPGSVRWPGQEEPMNTHSCSAWVCRQTSLSPFAVWWVVVVAFVTSVGLNKEMGVHVPFVPSSSCRVVPTAMSNRKTGRNEGHCYPRATACFENNDHHHVAHHKQRPTSRKSRPFCVTAHDDARYLLACVVCSPRRRNKPGRSLSS
jgi:hypothetical protein